MYDKRGSVWRKWDLHVHTPESYEENFGDSWDDYVRQVKAKAVEHEISVMGVTDYFSVDGYDKLINEYEPIGETYLELDNGRKLYLIPNVELRLDNFGDQDQSINLHVVFSERLNPTTIRDNFLEELQVTYGGKTLSCKESNLVKIGYCESEGIAFNADIDIDEFSSEEGRAYYRTALGLITLTFGNIRDELFDFKKSISEWGIDQGLYTFVIAAKGHGGLDSLEWTDEFIRGDDLGRAGNIRQSLLYHADICFSNHQNDKEFCLGHNPGCLKEEFINRFRYFKPCIWGSDAHDLDNLFHPSNGATEDYTWIKADPTFEGLRQIIFEPEVRIKIGSNIPNEPLIKINKVSLNLPDDSKLDDEEYCIRGQYNIQFSPFFTCFIGGRGTGKSSILNLIDHLVSDEKNNFFEQHILTDGDGNPVGIENVVSLDDKSEKGDLEFLSQNEIEDFAQDQHRFTQAIYRRLKKLDSENEIEKSVKKIKGQIANIDDQIDGFKELKTLRSDIKSLQKEIEKNQNILDSLQDEEYQEKSQELSDKTQRLQKINKSRLKLEEVLNSINQIKESIPEDLDDTIAFERALQEISDSLEEVSNAHDLEQLSEEAAGEIQELGEDIETTTEEINQFLEEKGLSKENLKEASAAKTNLDLLIANAEEKETASQKLQGKLEESSLDQSAKDSFEEVIQRHITKVNGKFESLDDDEHVKEIGLEYEFDFATAREELREKVKNWIEESDTEVDSSLRTDHFESRLFMTEPLDVDDHESFLEKLQSDETVIAKDLIMHFSDEYNFQIYKLMIAREYYHAEKYKQINVFYDGRPIRNTSFGQRCTAAIIILLSLGNNPIIIDEPEAHLDSALIADNLVDLIKSTKSQRQIIFATHNANFVVNGDAELIHVLSIDEDDGNKMKITPTTIEDLEKRSHLYALEGGEEAFKQRELRYNIS